MMCITLSLCLRILRPSHLQLSRISVYFSKSSLLTTFPYLYFQIVLLFFCNLYKIRNWSYVSRQNVLKDNVIYNSYVSCTKLKPSAAKYKIYCFDWNSIAYLIFFFFCTVFCNSFILCFIRYEYSGLFFLQGLNILVLHHSSVFSEFDAFEFSILSTITILNCILYFVWWHE